MKIENASVEWLESGLPYSSLYDDIYHSSGESNNNARAEARHVFMEGNRLKDRWSGFDEVTNRASLHEQTRSTSFSIGEIGFGTGLNFFETVCLWRQCKNRPARLHYIGFEKHPFTATQLRKIYQVHPELQEMLQQLLVFYPQHTAGCHRIPFASDITLDLYHGDALQQLSSRNRERGKTMNCWYLDGFSPKHNPDLWSEALLEEIAMSSKSECSLSSYSVAGHVRAGLQRAGFSCTKSEGFGRKRHMLTALLLRKIDTTIDSGLDTKPETALTGVNNTGAFAIPAKPAIKPEPWFYLPEPQSSGNETMNEAIVIGAGLAGCSTAYSLAKRGWKVTVVEQADKICAGASGIAQLALRCRIFRSHSSMAEFFLHSYLFAIRQFNSLAEQQADFSWQNCGVLQLDSAFKERGQADKDTLRNLYNDEVLSYLSAEDAADLSALPTTSGGWLHREGGWLDPLSLCEALLNHQNINLHLNCKVTRLTGRKRPAKNGWQLTSESGNTLQADAVILASSHGADEYSQTRQLPLQKVRGQISLLPASVKSSSINTVVNGERSVFPEHNGTHTISASYSNASSLQARDDDNMKNLSAAARNFSDGTIIPSKDTAVKQQVALRCNSEDHLPIIGPAPDSDAMKEIYAPLQLNATAKFTERGKYFPGLFLNVAHGSNGLASTALAGEYLASLMSGENLPLSREMINGLNPARFIIREMKKQKC
jgi:tRNA 5-methylaminomethyl-2-thiouridine biosynthesis bifunctional protein